MSEERAEAALGAIERAHRARLANEAAEAAAWVDFAVAYESGLNSPRLLAGDGTPAVDEFAVLELAAALRRSRDSVRLQLTDLLNLAYRLPGLWRAVQEARLPVWQARQFAVRTSALSAELAGWVDATLEPFAYRLGVKRLDDFCCALVAQADPDAAAAARERAKSWRGVELLPTADPAEGTRRLQGILDTADAIWLDAALDQLAGILARQGSADPHAQRRAAALGILATPARALAMIQHDLAQPELTDGSAPEFGESVDTATGEIGAADVRGPAGCDGHACGTITVKPDRLLPKATLIVHLGVQQLGDSHGVCRVEGVGPVPVDQLRELLRHSRVKVLPVFDPDGVAPVDSYEIPAPMRRAVVLRQPYEVFPYSSTPNAGCDLDHTRPWQAYEPPGQTSVDNLGPLSRRVHRAKTHARWQLRQPAPGVFVWTTPLGRTYTLTPDGLTHTGPPPDGRAVGVLPRGRQEEPVLLPDRPTA